MSTAEHIAKAKDLRVSLTLDLPLAASELKSFLSAQDLPSEMRKEAVMIYLETTDLIELDKLGVAPEWTPEAQELITRSLKLLDKWEAFTQDKTQDNSPVDTVRNYFLSQGIENTTVFSGTGIAKTYNGGNPPFTLGPLDIDLRYGEITGVVGENGNGKSTLLKIIAGKLSIDGGEVAYPGFCKQGELDWHKIKSKIGYIPQRLEKWSQSVRDNLRFSAAIHGIKAHEVDQEMEFILHRLNLKRFANAKWEDLSGGYQMRFEIARTLIWKPRLLILDEPLANLDIHAQLILLRDLRFLTNSLRHPLSIILSSQHLHKIEQVSDRVIFLREGKAVFNGPTAEIGVNRTENIYEVAGNFDAASVRNLFQRMEVKQVRDEGQTILIRTSRNVIGNDLLKKMVENNLEVQFFRDISQSTRQFFEVTG